MNSLRPHHIVSLLAAGGIVVAAMQFGGSPASGEPLFSSLDQFVLFAEEGIALEQGVQVSSGDLGSNEEIDIQKDAIITGNLFADEIEIDKNVQVNGSAFYNELDIKKESTILGTQTKQVQLPIALFPSIPDFSVGTEDKKFTGKNNALDPGSYRDITVEKDASLILPFSGTTYNLRKLELKEGATLLYSQNTTLNIKEELKAQQNVSIIPVVNNLTPQDLEIRYAGKKPTEFGKRAFLTLKLLAPKADIHIGEESTIRGQAVGREIKMERGSVLSNRTIFEKESDPTKVVEGQGLKFFANEIVILLKGEATERDAEEVAVLVGGKITGFVPSPPTYKIEIGTATAEENAAAIQKVKNSNNPLVVEVAPNLIGQQ